VGVQEKCFHTEKTPKGKYLAPDFIAGRFPAMLIWQIIIIIF